MQSPATIQREGKRASLLLSGFLVGGLAWALIAGISSAAYVYLSQVNHRCFIESVRQGPWDQPARGCIPFVVFAVLTSTRYGPAVLAPPFWDVSNSESFVVPILSGVLFASAGAVAFAIGGKRTGCAALAFFFIATFLGETFLLLVLSALN